MTPICQLDNYSAVISELTSYTVYATEQYLVAQQGLHEVEDGSIENEQGDKVLPLAFVSVIQHVLKSK